jgi:hypothetical protein
MLGPCQKRQWVPRVELLEILRSLPSDPSFFEDLGDMGGTLGDVEDPWKS